MTRTLSLARVFALGAWMAAVAVLSLSLGAHGWTVACDPARDDNPPDCREATGTVEDRLRMLEELLGEHYRHRAAFDVWSLDFRTAKVRIESQLEALEVLPASLGEQLKESLKAFEEGMQAHGYDALGRVRPNGADFDPQVWSEDVVVRRVDPSNSSRLISFPYSAEEQVTDMLHRFRALRQGDPSAAVGYWYDAEVTVAVNIASERQGGAETPLTSGCASPDACMRLDRLLRDWEAIWNDVLSAFDVETKKLRTEMQKFRNRVEGDRASAVARLGQLTDLKKKYPYENFSEEEAWLKEVIEDLQAVKDEMGAFEAVLDTASTVVGAVASKFQPRGTQAAAALSDFDVQVGRHREISRNLLKVGEFLEKRYGPERLLAGIDQLRYTDVHYYPNPRRATHLTLQTRGRYPGARREHARLFFNPQDMSKMSLCFTRNDACVFPPRPDPDQHMSYAGEVLPAPLYYHMRPFTRNRAYLLYGAGPGPGLDDDVGFARVRVWDDEWSDLSLDRKMTHSYLTMGSWMRAPEEGGFTPQFGAFVSIDNLGLGRNGRPQNVFAPPVRAWPRNVGEVVFYGEAEGVYAAGRTPQDTSAGVFTGGVVLVYEPPTTNESGSISGTIGGPPATKPDLRVSPLVFRPYYGRDPTPIKPGNLGGLTGNNRLETGTLPLLTPVQGRQFSLDATQNNAGVFRVTGLDNHRGWSSSDPTTLKLENIPLSTGQALGGGKAGILAHGEFQLSGTGPLGQSGPLWKTKSEIANGVERVVFDLDADGNKQPVLGVVPVALRLDPVHGPDGRWEVGFFNLDHPSTVKPAGIRHGAFAAGVFHLGYNWVLYGGSKGALTGAFAVTPHETSNSSN